MLTRRQFGFAAGAAQVAARRPNVLVVLCPEWRRQAMPGGDSALRLPNLARLAKEGVTFPRAYVANPASGPSRAALQTGRYPHSVGVPWNGRTLAPEYLGLAEGFVEAGYETGYVGKWDLDGGEPGRRGYQYAGADSALEFLAKKRTAPFLLFVSLGVPRAPRPYAADSLTPRENVPAAKAGQARKEMAAYYGLCAAMDEQVGRLLAGVAENTLVVFTSDQGAMLESQGVAGSGVWFEESVAVPLLLRWPGRLEAGTEQDFVFNNVDVAPTVRALCGVAAVEGANGEDRSALLLNRGVGTRPESLYVEGELGTEREWRMVIRGWDKLVVDRELKPTHLYNLAQDPYEKDNLVVDRATIRRQEELLALMRRWINKTGDRVPYPGKMPA